jgi:predicted phosphodiesterase
MSKLQVAVISDVHGNLWALSAVLDDIARRGVRNMVNLGDSLYGPLLPKQTASLVVSLGIPTVRGNEDRLILEDQRESADSPTLRHVQDSLRPQHLQWLATLDKTAVAFEDLFMCHGTPERDDEYLFEDVSGSGLRIRTGDELAPALAASGRPVLLCGHSHLPQVLRLPTGGLIMNPGSVGLPAYYDDQPGPHVMEAGTPHARYAVVSRTEAGWSTEAVEVDYDWDAAAGVAQRNGRPDWAQWLTTGLASSP